MIMRNWLIHTSAILSLVWTSSSHPMAAPTSTLFFNTSKSAIRTYNIGHGICNSLRPVTQDTKIQYNVTTFQVDDVVEVRNPNPTGRGVAYAIPAQIKNVIVTVKNKNHSSYSVTYDIVSGPRKKLTTNLDASVVFPMEVYPANTDALCYFRTLVPCTIVEHLREECGDVVGGRYVVNYECNGNVVRGVLPLIRIQRLVSKSICQELS